MKQAATFVMAFVLLTGFSAAVVGEQAPEEGPSITTEGPDAAGDKAPENISKGPMDRAKGLATAASKVPGDVANAVIGPLQDGVTGLGNVFDLGSLLGGEPENETSSDTSTEE